jgi:deoxycytidylate deaminase
LPFKRKDLQFMEWCKAGALIFSTCAKKKYMAILVDEANNIIGTGYNGGPSGAVHCDDGGCPRMKEGSASGSNYDNCIACHAEQNIFVRSDYSSKGTTLYVNGPPCFTCAKLIVNSTITRLVYIRDDSYADWPKVHKFLEDNKVECWGLNAS